MMMMMTGEHLSEAPPTPPLRQHEQQLLDSNIASRTDLKKMTIKQLKSYIQEFIMQPPPPTTSPQPRPEHHENNDYDNDEQYDDDNHGKRRKKQTGGDYDDVITIRSLKRKEDYVDYV